MNVAKAAQYTATTKFWLAFGFLPVFDDNLASCVTCLKLKRSIDKIWRLPWAPNATMGIMRLANISDMRERAGVYSLTRVWIQKDSSISPRTDLAFQSYFLLLQR